MSETKRNVSNITKVLVGNTYVSTVATANTIISANEPKSHDGLSTAYGFDCDEAITGQFVTAEKLVSGVWDVN